MALQTVDIRPGVSVLAVLRHLNYKPWYALSEFVDNSVASFLSHQKELKDVHDSAFKLRVKIDIDSSPPASISIKDNAAGIFENEYRRAFRPAEIPPDRTGLAEFGMGMKSAACWFAPCWSVRTSALGEQVARKVEFDIANIINDDISELNILETAENPNSHYTEVILKDIFHTPVGRTVTKLKEHLSDIYRAFIRDGLLELRFNGDILNYEEPPILIAPYYKEEDGKSVEWKKDISFDFGNGLHVYGFAALREKANTSKAGFALFRRGRVIQGSGDEGYRPAQIFGSSNSYRYQRLFGELHLEGFEVSHTKDGFRWDENEEPFLELLHEHLDSEDMPLLKQAEGYRVLAARSKLKSNSEQAVANTTRTMEERLPDTIPIVAEEEPVSTPEEISSDSSTIAERQFNIRVRDKDWSISVEISDDPAESDWLVISDTPEITSSPRTLRIRISMRHPFMIRFAQNNIDDIEAILRIAVAIALAEILARDSGVRQAGTVRRNVNEILREVLSHP